jgi:hypothetical protein
MEEVASKKNTAVQSIMLVLAWIIMIVSALYAVMQLQSIFYVYSQYGVGLELLMTVVEMLLFGGLAVLLYLKKDTIKTEYEYTFTNGVMDFAQVFNNKKRKNLGTMNLKNIAACGLVSSGSFNRYINTPGVKRNNWFVNREAELFYFYFEKDSKKSIIIIEPSQDMIAMIRRAVGQGVYQVN